MSVHIHTKKTRATKSGGAEMDSGGKCVCVRPFSFVAISWSEENITIAPNRNFCNDLDTFGYILQFVELFRLFTMPLWTAGVPLWAALPGHLRCWQPGRHSSSTRHLRGGGQEGRTTKGRGGNRPRSPRPEEQDVIIRCTCFH